MVQPPHVLEYRSSDACVPRSAATYKVGSRAKFEVSLPDSRSHSLYEIVLNQRTSHLHLRFAGKLTRPLKDGDVFTLMLIADENLPDYIERWEEDYAILAVYGNSHARFHVANPGHHILIFGLPGKPHGGVEIRNGHAPPFPEQGPPRAHRRCTASSNRTSPSLQAHG